MIFDKIENFELYVGLNKKIAKAFGYIIATDLSQLAPGKYEIDQDDIFALVQEYDTKDKENCKLEAHKKYIDLQYIINGVELMGISSLKDQVAVEKNEKDDYAFYEGDSDFIKVNNGMFTIFFPDDLHMPGIKINHSSKVKKVVIKVKI